MGTVGRLTGMFVRQGVVPLSALARALAQTGGSPLLPGDDLESAADVKVAGDALDPTAEQAPVVLPVPWAGHPHQITYPLALPLHGDPRPYS